MSNNDFNTEWVDADVKMVLVDGVRRLALIVRGSIVALMDPRKVQEQLRFYGE